MSEELEPIENEETEEPTEPETETEVNQLLVDVKQCLRISNTSFDTEIQDLIDAAKADLVLSGVLESKIVDTDLLIKRAIIIYVKANFGFENPDYDKLERAYNSLKNHLTLSQEYIVGDAE